MFNKDFCWRGVSRKRFIDENGLLTFDALVFDKLDKTNRTDNFLELSVNWDDLNSLENLFQQKSENKVQFCAAGKIDIQHLKMCLKVLITNNTFSVEESPKEDNEFHGNLLMDANLESKIVKSIKNAIIYSCGTNIFYNDKYEAESE